MKENRVVRFEDARCVWKLDCPYCGWLFGFCLDMTGQGMSMASFTVNGKPRIPSRFPKNEGGGTYAYFPVRTRTCRLCGARCVPDHMVRDWFISRGRLTLELDTVEEILIEHDPEGTAGQVHSDRVYDVQLQEWGTDGMPCRYLFVRNEKRLFAMLKRFVRFRV